MTIAERKAREEYDRRHPWLPIGEAKPDGSICHIRRTDLEDFGLARFFLGDDDRWYRIDPPEQMAKKRGRGLIEYRPTGAYITKAKREIIVSTADGAYVKRLPDGTVKHLEYSGGRLVAKPKPYKLYWRAGGD